MATSGSFDTNVVGSFYVTFEWVRTSYDVAANTNTVYYKFTAHNTPGNYRTVYNMDGYVNGTKVIDTTSGIPYYDGDIIAEGYTTINNNASGDGSFSASFNGGVGTSTDWNCSGSGSWNLDRIPRYANFTEHYVESTGLNSIKVHWNADSSCDWLQYSLNNGSWVDVAGHPTYTITGLAPNTQYNIRTRIRRADSGLWTESGYIYGTTKDIARITKAPNVIHGDSLKVEYSNPSGSSLEIGIWKTDGTTMLTGGYRSCSGSSYTFNFTDEELDRIYKLYGNNNQITVRAYLRTAGSSSYLNYKDFTITLTGNQKTIKVKVNGEYKRGKIWVKTNGEWRRAVIWAKQTEWKRGI